MQFIYKFHKTALYFATEDGDLDIVKRVLSYKNIDPNIVIILNSLFQYNF